MTLVIGMLAHGGAVIAADRESGVASGLKLEEGKISGQWVVNRGGLVVSGAGNGPYIDTFTATLHNWFKADGTDFDRDRFEEELKQKHYDFYSTAVMPFTPYEEAVDYELLVCLASAPTAQETTFSQRVGGLPGKAPELWTSHKLTVLKEHPFAAVGCGAATAKALLQKYWLPLLPMEVAISLVAFIVYEVKRTVKDVGLGTDIMVLRSPGIPAYVSPKEIAAMEARFFEYNKVERGRLYSLLGGDLAEHEEFTFQKKGSYERRELSLRRFFEKLNAARLSQWGWKRQPKAPFL